MASYNSRSSLYITLKSSDSLGEYPANTLTGFRNRMFTPIEICMDSEWTVSLIDLSLPINVANLSQTVCIGFSVPCLFTPATSNDSLLRSTDCEYRDAEENLESRILTETPVSPHRLTTMIYKEGYIESGYYHSVKEILESIEKLFLRLFSEYNDNGNLLCRLTTSYDKFNRRSTLVSEHTNQIRYTRSSTNSLYVSMYSSKKEILSTILGLAEYEIESLTSEDYESSGQQTQPYKVEINNEVQSTKKCRIPDYTRLYVCCDIVEHQYIGSSTRQVLASFVINKDALDSQRLVIGASGSSARKIEILSGLNRIESIMLSLYSELDHYVPYPTSATDTVDSCECTLHLQRTSLL